MANFKRFKDTQYDLSETNDMLCYELTPVEIDTVDENNLPIKKTVYQIVTHNTPLPPEDLNENGEIDEDEKYRPVTSANMNALLTDIENEFAQKASTAQLAEKASVAQITALDNAKADKSTVNALNTTVDALNTTKADKTELSLKADKSTVDSLSATKADKSEMTSLLNAKADKTSLTALQTHVNDLFANAYSSSNPPVKLKFSRESVVQSVSAGDTTTLYLKYKEQENGIGFIKIKYDIRSGTTFYGDQEGTIFYIRLGGTIVASNFNGNSYLKVVGEYSQFTIENNGAMYWNWDSILEEGFIAFE